MLLAALPGPDIRAAINILILTLTLKLVSCKLPLVQGSIRHPHDALPFPLACSIAAGIATALSHQVQPHSLPPVIAVLPKVGVSIAVHCLGTIVLPRISAVKTTCTSPLVGIQQRPRWLYNHHPRQLKFRSQCQSYSSVADQAITKPTRTLWSTGCEFIEDI